MSFVACSGRHLFVVSCVSMSLVVWYDNCCFSFAVERRLCVSAKCIQLITTDMTFECVLFNMIFVLWLMFNYTCLIWYLLFFALERRLCVSAHGRVQLSGPEIGNTYAYIHTYKYMYIYIYIYIYIERERETERDRERERDTTNLGKLKWVTKRVSFSCQCPLNSYTHTYIHMCVYIYIYIYIYIYTCI